MPDSSNAPVPTDPIAEALRTRPWIPRIPVGWLAANLTVILTVCLTLAGPFPLAGPLSAQRTGFDLDIRLIEELAGIQETLDRVVTLLERQSMQRDHELLLRRVELGDRRVAPLEDAVQRARERRDSILTEQREIEAQLERIADLVDSGELDLEVDTLDAQMQFLDQQLETLEVRLIAAHNNLIELENELTRRRADVEIWQDRLDSLLSGK